jgi:Protein of unknown function (DUF4058)
LDISDEFPLKSPDADVALDLPTALQPVYDEAAYDLSIDYTKSPPPPALSEGDRAWMARVLSRCSINSIPDVNG